MKINNKKIEKRDKLIGEVIDDLKEDKVKLAEFQGGFIDHVFLMEKTFDKVYNNFQKEIKQEAIKWVKENEKFVGSKVYNLWIKKFFNITEEDLE